MRFKSFSILVWVVIGAVLVGVMPLAISLYQINSSRDDIVIQTQQTHLVAVKSIASSISAYIAMLLAIAETTARNPNLYIDPASKNAQEILTGLLLSKSELEVAAIYTQSENNYELVQRAKRKNVDKKLSASVQEHAHQSVSIIKTTSGQWLNVTIQIANLNLTVQLVSKFAAIDHFLWPVEFGDSADIAVVNRNSGRVVAGKKISLAYFPVKILNQALSNNSGAGAERYKMEGGEVGVSAFASINNAPWFVLSNQPAHIAEQASTRMWHSAIQILIVIMVLSLLFTIGAYRKIICPLRKLITAHQTLLGETPGEHSGSEIRQLEDSFDKLQKNINAGVALNQIFLDRYQVMDVIGVGNMGTVLRGWDPKLKRYVALKTVRLDMEMDSDTPNNLKDHLLNEAVTAAKLTHPNIVTVYDVINSGAFAFIAMEFIDGVSLHDYLQQEKYLSIEEFSLVATAILSGLSCAHAEGVIHRDIKPANILIGKDAEIKITDFGVASLLSENNIDNIFIKGTPTHFSPEIWLENSYSKYSDLFALGVVFYRCLTGEMPFTLDQIPPTNIVKIIAAVVPPKKLRPEIPTLINDRVMQLLAVNTDERNNLTEIFLGELKKYVRVNQHWPNMENIKLTGTLNNENKTISFINDNYSDTAILFHRD